MVKGSSRCCGFTLTTSIFQRAWAVRLKPAGVYALLLFLLVTSASVTRSTRAEIIQKNDESPKFIGAFELTQQNGFSFIWPFESMRPSSNKSVLLVVTRMPQVRNGNGKGVSQPLIASRDLRINGRAQKPSQVIDRQTYFTVKLEKGRLRVTLSVPPGMRIDPQNDVARIKLYEPALRKSKGVDRGFKDRPRWRLRSNSDSTQ